MIDMLTYWASFGRTREWDWNWTRCWQVSGSQGRVIANARYKSTNGYRLAARHFGSILNPGSHSSIRKLSLHEHPAESCSYNQVVISKLGICYLFSPKFPNGTSFFAIHNRWMLRVHREAQEYDLIKFTSSQVVHSTSPLFVSSRFGSQYSIYQIPTTRKILSSKLLRSDLKVLSFNQAVRLSCSSRLSVSLHYWHENRPDLPSISPAPLHSKPNTAIFLSSSSNSPKDSIRGQMTAFRSKLFGKICD